MHMIYMLFLLGLANEQKCIRQRHYRTPAGRLRLAEIFSKIVRIIGWVYPFTFVLAALIVEKRRLRKRGNGNTYNVWCWGGEWLRVGRRGKSAWQGYWLFL